EGGGGEVEGEFFLASSVVGRGMTSGGRIDAGLASGMHEADAAAHKVCRNSRQFDVHCLCSNDSVSTSVGALTLYHGGCLRANRAAEQYEPRQCLISSSTPGDSTVSNRPGCRRCGFPVACCGISATPRQARRP